MKRDGVSGRSAAKTAAGAAGASLGKPVYRVARRRGAGSRPSVQRAFVGARRSLLVTELVQVASVKLVKSRDAFGGSLAEETVERGARFARSPDSRVRDLLELEVSSHDQSRFPQLPTQ